MIRFPNVSRSPAYPHGRVERGLSQPRRHGRDAEPSRVQTGECDLQAVTLGSEAALDRHSYVVEAHGGRRRTGQPHLPLGPVSTQPRSIGRHEEARDPVAIA